MSGGGDESSSGARPAKVAVVSGGSRGLGQEIVTRLLAEDWAVATCSRSGSDALDKARDEHPERFHWESVDLAEPGAPGRFAAAAAERFGRIDLLVNNAAILPAQQLFLTMPSREVDQLVATNLVAPILLTQACVRVMARGKQGGQVLTVSSINAVRGYRGVAAYAATKAGLDGFGRSLARELGPLGIRVNSVVPGFFESDMTAGITEANRERIAQRTPLGRLGHVGEVADVVMSLVTSGSFVTGQTIVVDGGITC